MTSKEILALLAVKHSKDLFVAECKNGSTWGEGPTIRLDAWAMRRSWTRWTTWGYEIKVNRSDFVQDEKWQEYLPLCHQFSFVCPYHLIEPEELPQDVGLVWVTKKGNRLHTKRKAVARDIEMPTNVLLYVLMARTVIVSDMYEANRSENSRQYWTAWLQQKEGDQILGAQVRTRLGELLEESERRARHAEARADRVEETARLIEEVIEGPIDGLRGWNRKARLRELLCGLPPELASTLIRTRDAATEAAKYLESVGVGSRVRTF